MKVDELRKSPPNFGGLFLNGVYGNSVIKLFAVMFLSAIGLITPTDYLILLLELN
ncbi:hypothetical protein Runsl_4152 [Runella slithyformis DSM 19594]|uniref:Uncharacterized protein n=1 Tax=Runella slithyformis (strain ATCC 29530 / DSM 19594 / LMG 11500 / NCIMB 11436 / LSU 4) TaxID=761193 RepID=A0A7U3ZNJ6_RUNSL|nr:hypothetical protein Runsl_4152 [Runella slithyformis DSM 19594]